jgi:hypothetical protein
VTKPRIEILHVRITAFEHRAFKRSARINRKTLSRWVRETLWAAMPPEVDRGPAAGQGIFPPIGRTAGEDS